MGANAHECEAKCTNCMACMDSDDPSCEKCGCCTECLPLAAKCGLLSNAFDDVSYVHVAIFNHRRLYNERLFVQGVVNLGLREEPSFVQPNVPSDWIAALYDSFQNVQDLEYTLRTRYPDGEQFLYDFDLNRSETLRQEVRLFSQRLTLLHLRNSAEDGTIRLAFSAGPNVTHVLTASVAAPRTLFDFDQVHLQENRGVRIMMLGRSDIWCALFAGADDASVVVTASLEPSSGRASALVFGVLCVFTLFCVLIVMCSACSGAKRRREKAEEEGAAISERLAGLVRPSHRTTAASERSQGVSLQGYMSTASDFIDPSVEEQYLFRGGIGDDGM